MSGHRGQVSAGEGIKSGLTRRGITTWVVVGTAAWTVESIVYALRLISAPNGSPVDTAAVLVESWASACLWVPFTVMTSWLAFRWPVTRHPRQYFCIHNLQRRLTAAG